MNHPVPCSGVPPDDLLDLLYHYKALQIRHLPLWFAGRESAVDHLLRRFSFGPPQANEFTDLPIYNLSPADQPRRAFCICSALANGDFLGCI